MREGAPDFKYGIFRLPTPPGGKYLTIGGGWAFVANARGLEPQGGRRVLRLGARLDEAGLGRPDRRLVHQGQERHAADASRRSKAGKAAFDSGFLKMFTDEIYPGARAEPRMPPPVYKAISDAIQACQLNGQKPEDAAAAASEQIDAFLAGYKGAPIL